LASREPAKLLFFRCFRARTARPYTISSLFINSVSIHAFGVYTAAFDNTLVITVGLQGKDSALAVLG